MNRFDTLTTDDAISRADDEFSVRVEESWRRTTHSIGRLGAVEQAQDGALTRSELRDVVAGYAANGQSLTRSERERFVSRFGETTTELRFGSSSLLPTINNTPKMP